MRKIARREFLGETGLSMVAYTAKINDNDLLTMYFTLFINNKDVTLHREVSLKDYPNRELNLDSAYAKIERLINALKEYITWLQDGRVVNDHRGIGVLVEPDNGEYVGETSTAHLWAHGEQVIFSLTSCENKLRTTYSREATIELLTTIIGHLVIHLNDVKTLAEESID